MAAAVAHPATRSGMSPTDPGSVTGRTNANSSDVAELASTELTTPAKMMPNATTSVTITASHTSRAARLPMQTRTAPATPSATCACTRSAIEPE